jgi:hypothetical protein
VDNNILRKYIREILTECFVNEGSDWSDIEYNAIEDFNEKKENAISEIVYDLLKKRRKKQIIKKAPKARLFKIWTDYSKLGLVRDEKGIEEISKIFIDNIAKLSANTYLAGHTPNDPIPDVMYLSNITKEQAEEILNSDEFIDYIEDYNGQLRISDYGLDKLEALAFELMTKADTPEQKLIVLDKILNVAHQRSDLSRLFVEGGSGTLDVLFET